jgi:hypothetical protein
MRLAGAPRAAAGPIASRRRRTPAPPSATPDNAAPGRALDRAAAAFAADRAKTDLPDEDLVARQLGAKAAAQLTEVQALYAGKVRAALEERAAALAAERAARSREFAAGKELYARGEYPRAAAVLELALDRTGPFTQEGGEVQMWLALAYEACGRADEAAALYKAVEASHPMPAVRKQAREMRYIMEAPVLELGEDERVQIPLMAGAASHRRGKEPAPRARAPAGPPREKRWDESYWEEWEPPRYFENSYVWAASALVAAGLAWYSAAAGR